MYDALIQPDVLIDKNSNNKLWKLKIPLNDQGIQMLPPEESNSHQR
jgi:hypothetical protein